MNYLSTFRLVSILLSLIESFVCTEAYRAPGKRDRMLGFRIVLFGVGFERRLVASKEKISGRDIDGTISLYTVL